MNLSSHYVEFHEKGKVSVKKENLSGEGLEPWEVILQSEVSLVSAGTELARLHGAEAGLTYPFRPGYASIGRILEKGSAVTDFKVGDRVFYSGRHASHQRFQHGQNHQWGRLYPVPEGLAPEDAVFVCLAEISMTAPNITQLDLGDTVAVFGLGLVGNLAAQLYALKGVRVIALDPVAQRCELARKVGIGHVISVPPDQQVKAVMDMTGEKGAEVTVDAAGHSAVIANCVAATALFGQVLLLGSPRASYTADMMPMLNRVHQKGLVMRGAHQWRFPADDVRGARQTVPWAFRTLFEMMASGKLKVSPLRSHFVKADQAPRVYEGLEKDKENYWGVVFDWRE